MTMSTAEKVKVETDPLWDLPEGSMDDSVYKGEHFSAIRGAGGRHCEQRNREAVEDGSYVGQSGSWICTRNTHPEEWKHIATSGREVLGYWGGVDLTDVVETEVDPEPDPFTPEVGVLYKFRNRPTILMYLGDRKNGQIEVLDLTHQRYRVLDRTQIVPRKDNAEALTVDQLKWVGTFMAERRAQVRTTALQQRRDGFFKSVDDLNKVLNELGLEPHITRKRGTMMPEFTVVVTGMSSAQASDVMAGLFASLEAPPGIEFVTRPTSRRMNMSVYDE